MIILGRGGVDLFTIKGKSIIPTIQKDFSKFNNKQRVG